MSFNYAGDPSVSDVASIRFEIQDTDASAPLTQDEEIGWAVLAETGAAPATPASLALTNPQGFFSACARVLETLARLFAAQADTQVGQLKTTYSKQAQTYTQRAADLRSKAASFGAPYAGGMSLSEKESTAQNTDAIPPRFAIDAFDSPYSGEDAGFGLTPADLGPPFPG